MNEQVLKEQIKAAYAEPHAPEALIRSVAVRANAVRMGIQAQNNLKTASPEEYPELVSVAIIGQLAAAAPLPEGAEPGKLARQLQQLPQYTRALRGGNVAQRLASGELVRQITGKQPPQKEETPQINAPQKQGPIV